MKTQENRWERDTQKKRKVKLKSKTVLKIKGREYKRRCSTSCHTVSSLIKKTQINSKQKTKKPDMESIILHLAFK